MATKKISALLPLETVSANLQLTVIPVLDTTTGLTKRVTLQQINDSIEANIPFAAAAFTQANTSGQVANSASASASLASVRANAGFIQSNSSFIHANASFDASNGTSTSINTAASYANSAFIRANNSIDVTELKSLVANAASYLDFQTAIANL